MSETGASLLIVDDEPSIRESLSLALTEIGYPVRAAHKHGPASRISRRIWRP